MKTTAVSEDLEKTDITTNQEDETNDYDIFSIVTESQQFTA